jgi:hypothetical protein
LAEIEDLKAANRELKDKVKTQNEKNCLLEAIITENGPEEQTG